MHPGRLSKHDGPPRRLQFSLRSLLIVVTFCCLGLSLLTYMSFPYWALPVLGVLAWSGLVAGQGGAALAAAAGYRRHGPEREFWLSVARRWAVLLAAAAAIAPVITFLLSVAAICCFGPDLGQIGPHVVRLITNSAGVGSHGVWFSAWLALLLVNPASGVLNLVSCTYYFRPRQDFPFLLVRVFGLLNCLVATGVTFGVHPDL